jgi:hypothetical protein
MHSLFFASITIKNIVKVMMAVLGQFVAGQFVARQFVAGQFVAMMGQ